MPRNSSGTYILPAGNPVVADTLIDVDWANPTMEDIGNALTGSLPRNGTAGMTGPLRLAADGVTPLEAVTVQQLAVATAGTSHFLPAGSYMEFAFDAIPAEYLYADGRAVSRTTYSDLFTAIGVLYGTGDGSTTFNLPDRRGVFARGLDSGRNLDPARVLGSYQGGANLEHTHGVTIANHTHTATTPAHAHGVNDPSHAHPTPDFVKLLPSNTGNLDRTLAGAGQFQTNGNSTAAAVTGITIQAANTPITVSSVATPATAAVSGTESRPVNISVVVCIRAYGSYITGQLGTMALQNADDVLITGGTGTFDHLEVTTAPVHDNDVVRLIDIASAGNLTGLLSGDVQTIVIDNTDPAVPVIRPQTNVPNGLVKLNGAGKVNPSQISLSDINYIGPWDASTGNTPVGTFVSGSMFQIDIAGVMNVITSSGVLAPQLCSIGSQIIYQDDSSPTFPLVGWYYQPPPALTGATASQVTNVPAGSISATDVQGALNELDADLTAHTTNTANPHATTAAQVGAVDLTTDQTVAGVKTFTGSIVIENAVPLIEFRDTDQPANRKRTRWILNAGVMILQWLNDAGTVVGDFIRFSSFGEIFLGAGGGSAGTAGQVATSGGAGQPVIWKSLGGEGASVTLSGIQSLFTIPAGVKKIELLLTGVSTNGVANVRVQLGTGGVQTTSGYAGGVAHISTSANTTSVAIATSGFDFPVPSASNSINSILTFTRFGSNVGASTWLCGVSGTINSGTLSGGGVIFIAGEVDLVRLVTGNGVDIFDAGFAQARWYF